MSDFLKTIEQALTEWEESHSHGDDDVLCTEPFEALEEVRDVFGQLQAVSSGENAWQVPHILDAALHGKRWELMEFRRSLGAAATRRARDQRATPLDYRRSLGAAPPLNLNSTPEDAIRKSRGHNE